jgi:CO dehydrogenase/acetyl-CoA synthase beta subunit
MQINKGAHWGDLESEEEAESEEEEEEEEAEEPDEAVSTNMLCKRTMSVPDLHPDGRRAGLHSLCTGLPLRR